MVIHFFFSLNKSIFFSYKDPMGIWCLQCKTTHCMQAGKFLQAPKDMMTWLFIAWMVHSEGCLSEPLHHQMVSVKIAQFINLFIDGVFIQHVDMYLYMLSVGAFFKKCCVYKFLFYLAWEQTKNTWQAPKWSIGIVSLGTRVWRGVRNSRHLCHLPPAAVGLLRSGAHSQWGFPILRICHLEVILMNTLHWDDFAPVLCHRRWTSGALATFASPSLGQLLALLVCCVICQWFCRKSNIFKYI